MAMLPLVQHKSARQPYQTPCCAGSSGVGALDSPPGLTKSGQFLSSSYMCILAPVRILIS